MKRVYYDVENTLDLPFITGIQRVVREFSKVVLQDNSLSLKHQYIPIIYDHKRLTWRRLTRNETRSLLSNIPRSTKLLPRIARKLTGLLPRKHLTLDVFEPGSIFLDIESSWHSKLKRQHLLPELTKSYVSLAKLHYDIIPLIFPDTSHPETVRVFSEHFASHLKHTALFLCISETTRNDVERYCQQNRLKEPQLKTIQLGTNLTDLNESHVSTKAATSITAKYGRYILSVGTIEPRKNFPLLLEAFTDAAQASDLNLVIVGKTGWLSEQIRRDIHAHALYGKRVHHLENVPDTLLNNLYNNAWLNTVPSLYEGFGLPVVESLARNCPTLCSDAGSLGEFDQKHVMFFSSGSSDELSSAISALDRDKTRYAELVEGAKNFTPVSWLQTARQVDDSLCGLGKKQN